MERSLGDDIGGAVGVVDPEVRLLEEGSGRGPGLSGRLGSRLADRKWAMAAYATLIISGLVFMFAWDPVVRHSSGWFMPEDVWQIFRAAHFVGWGDVAGIYTPANGVVAFPGFPVLMAPIAMLAGTHHLTESYSPIFLAHPTAALLLQPFELLVSGTAIFASDALAQRLAIGRRRRIAVCFVAAAVVWPVAALWGHAEDALAMTFAIYALIAAVDRKWTKCGWMLGCGIAIQPLVLLIVPVVIASTPAGKRLIMAFRSVALSAGLLVIAFLGDAADTYRAVVQQPALPSINHATPWLALSPVLSAVRARSGAVASTAFRGNHFVVTTTHGSIHSSTVVTGGLGRSLYLVFAVIVGLYVWRRPQPPQRLLWLVTVVLAARCFFESVMCPYYLAPPLLLALVLAARTSRPRYWAAVTIAVATSVFSYFSFSPWAWWLPVIAGLAAVLALGYPGHRTRVASSAGSDVTDHGADADAEPMGRVGELELVP